MDDRVQEKGLGFAVFGVQGSWVCRVEGFGVRGFWVFCLGFGRLISRLWGSSTWGCTTALDALNEILVIRYCRWRVCRFTV